MRAVHKCTQTDSFANNESANNYLGGGLANLSGPFYKELGAAGEAKIQIDLFPVGAPTCPLPQCETRQNFVRCAPRQHEWDCESRSYKIHAI